MYFVKIQDRTSSFIYVNEKFCNKNLFLDLFNVVLKEFPDFNRLKNMHRGSSVELNALGEIWRCRKRKRIGYCPFAGLCRNRDFSVMTVGLVLRQELVWARCFWITTEPPGSMLRHGFPYVATWFSVLSYRKCRNMVFLSCDRFGLAWGFCVATKSSQG